MIRKQVYIEERQERILKKTARKLGVPEAELIRRGIDQTLRPDIPAVRTDVGAWTQEKQFIAQLRQRPATAKVKHWTRAELYE
jgi:hypothetical protein